MIRLRTVLATGLLILVAFLVLPPFVMLFIGSLWESRKHFEAWIKSEEFAKGHARSGTLPKEAFTGSNKLELHEVFLDSSRPDLEEESPGGPFKIH